MNLEFANLFGIGNPTEVMIIAGVVILLFGGSKIAGFGKSLGDGMKEFKKATREMQEEEPKLATAEPSAPAMMESVQPAAAGLPIDGTPHTAEAVNIPTASVATAQKD